MPVITFKLDELKRLLGTSLKIEELSELLFNLKGEVEQVASGEIFLNIWVKNVGPVNINITDAKIDNTIAVSDLIGKTLASGNEISIVTTISNLSTGKHILTITFDDGTGEKTRMFPFSI